MKYKIHEDGQYLYIDSSKKKNNDDFYYINSTEILNHLEKQHNDFFIKILKEIIQNDIKTKQNKIKELHEKFLK